MHRSTGSTRTDLQVLTGKAVIGMRVVPSAGAENVNLASALDSGRRAYVVLYRLDRTLAGRHRMLTRAKILISILRVIEVQLER